MPNLKTVTIWVVTTLAAFVAGIFTNDFVEFRSDTRAALETRINDFDGTTKAVDRILTQFAKISSGKAPVRPEDFDVLRSSLLEFQIAAREISYNVPVISPEYRALENAINQILDQASKLSTADKNKPFVGAVENFLFSAAAFQKRAIEAQGSYLTGITS
ncbi:hypothetical protein [Sinorhizobium meliloti]|uniref:hypothetical protein n=1 Tax=Rhizobium meliloti TaxID=382 RepID=UPI001F1E971E|nr:hypothetical protein [Sinorhizobium meliloti]